MQKPPYCGERGPGAVPFGLDKAHDSSFTDKQSMSRGQRIIFIPFEGGVAADSAINGTLEHYKNKYTNCRVVHWPFGEEDYSPNSWRKKSKDWSTDQSNSPLGKGVDVTQDVIIIVGHGDFYASKLSVKSNTTVAVPARTNVNKIQIVDGNIILLVDEVAARLKYMGLRSDHKFIKTTSCCGSGIGDYDLRRGTLDVNHVAFPHNFAMNLALELGPNHPAIRVGGYPGYVDCKREEKQVSPRVARGSDDGRETVMEQTTSIVGTTKSVFGTEFPKVLRRDLYNIYQSANAAQHPDQRLIILPVRKECPNCGQLGGAHAENCGLQGQQIRLVPVIWYDHLGRVLRDKTAA
jgi:hypothetical protein